MSAEPALSPSFLRVNSVEGTPMVLDSHLDPTIQIAKRAPLTSSLAQPRSLFLTGATGFLGAYLLAELLQQTEATIYCLVRAADTKTAQERLSSHLSSYGLWQDEWQARIVLVVGDLSKPRLGLTDAHFADLADRLDGIYHNGAWVNVIYPYERLRATNVLGTQEMIRLAAMGKTKPLHYVSSLAIFLSDRYANQSVTEELVPSFDPTLRGGYRQSKWVAEALVRDAQARGLPAVIYRTGRITGHSQTGITGNLNDLLCMTLKACVELGCFPQVATQVELTPVDYVSRGIVQLSRRADVLGRTFHLCHPQATEWVTLMEQIGELGYPMTGVSYSEWVAAVNAATIQQPKDRFYQQWRLLLRAPIYLFAQDKPHDSSRATQEALAPLRCPPIDQRLLATYFAWFQQVGYLVAPSFIRLPDYATR
ncbi:MAG: thioester reductase domain-containing protein [Chloroflexota bacterium]|nr:thioester reductase domain-containing protein [Chloroflexota bacterium]